MIRNLKNSDISELVRIEEQSFGKSLGERFFLNELNNQLTHYLIFEINGSVVGYIGSWFSLGLIEIINFAIDKDYRNKGYGTLLIEQLIYDGVVSNMDTIILDVKETNTKAIKFYKRFGFKMISIRKKYYDGEIDAINLEKKLVK